MPTLFTRFKRRSSTASSTTPVNDLRPPAIVVPHHQRPLHEPIHQAPIQRKIHHDLDSLLEAHISTHPPIDPPRSALDAPEAALQVFPGLEPSRRNVPQQKALALSNAETASSNLQPELGANIISRLANLSESTAKSTLPTSLTIPSPSSAHLGGWSTFGRGKPIEATKSGDVGETTNNQHIIVAAPSQPPSRTNSHSHLTGLETQPQTPTSISQQSYTTPLQNQNGDVSVQTPSPHTFGNPTPPSSGFTFGSRHSSPPNINADEPPPMPPLDHPAFNLPSSSTFNGKAQKLRNRGSLDITENAPHLPRPSSSLPTMSSEPSERRIKTSRSTSSTKNKRASRSRSSSRTQLPSRVKAMDIFRGSSQKKEDDPEAGPSQRRPRARTMSKSSTKSNTSSRRASAEFSALQAVGAGQYSSIGDSWEARVSREMVRASLDKSVVGERRPAADQSAGGAAEHGQTRGHNHILSIPSNSAQLLGSPFLLQDTHTHNFADTSSDHNTKTDTGKSSTHKKGKSKEKPPQMSHDLDTPSPSPSKRRERELEKRDGIAPLPTKKPGPRRSATTGSRPRVGSAQQLAPIPYLGPTSEGPSLLAPPSLSLMTPTPEPSPTSLNAPHTSVLQHQKSATEPASRVLKQASAPQMKKSSSGGKRKADEAGVEGGSTPPKDQQHSRSTTFAVGPRPHRASERSSSSHAPSSYHRKRPRLSTDSQGRPGTSSRGESTTAANTGSWSSRGSGSNAFMNFIGSPSGSSNNPHSRPPSTTPQRPSSRRSLSQVSLPISALVSPHAPSVSRSSTYHMRDPRKPAPIQSTPWSLSFPSADGEKRSLAFGGWVERGGSPLHAWLFFMGFVVFPMWWVAAFLRVKQTRTIGGGEAEKGAVVLDDPQLEHDAHSWRRRCRIMAGVSLVTYIPFIVLVAIFAR